MLQCFHFRNKFLIFYFTRSLRSWIKIVRALFPGSNLYIFYWWKLTFKWSLCSKKYCVYSSLHIRLKNGTQSVKTGENKNMLSYNLSDLVKLEIHYSCFESHFLNFLKASQNLKCATVKESLSLSSYASSCLSNVSLFFYFFFRDFY